MGDSKPEPASEAPLTPNTFDRRFSKKINNWGLVFGGIAKKIE